MNHLLCLILIVISSISLWSQNQIGIQVGRSFSSFQFTDSSGDRNDDYRFISGDRLSIAYGSKLRANGTLQAEVGYRQGGARLYDQNDLFQWQLHYLDLALVYDLSLDINDYAQARIGAGMYGAYLLSGQQQIVNQFFDLKANNSLSVADFGFQLRASIYHQISPSVQLGLQYAYWNGLLNLEAGTNNSGQRSLTRAHTLGISIVSDIQK